MKIRIKGSSIRLRLTKVEVNQLIEQGKVSDECRIIDRILIYKIRTEKNHITNATFIDNTIEVIVDQALVLNWKKDEEVSISETTIEGLNLLIEKDFKCLIQRPDEDNDDMYKNPRS